MNLFKNIMLHCTVEGCDCLVFHLLLCKYTLSTFLAFLLIRFINFLGWNSPEQMDNLSEEFEVPVAQR